MAAYFAISMCFINSASMSMICTVADFLPCTHCCRSFVASPSGIFDAATLHALPHLTSLRIVLPRHPGQELAAEGGDDDVAAQLPGAWEAAVANFCAAKPPGCSVEFSEY